MIVFISILVVLLDQLSKILFTKILTPYHSIPIIKEFFHFTLVQNTGIAFGMFKGSSTVILVVTIIGVVLIIYSLRNDLWVIRSKGLPFTDKLAMGFILGGAIGNFIDRIRLGYVIDFLDFRIWPVFNLADSFITIGAVILLWKTILPSKFQKQ